MKIWVRSVDFSEPPLFLFLEFVSWLSTKPIRVQVSWTNGRRALYVSNQASSSSAAFQSTHCSLAVRSWFSVRQVLVREKQQQRCSGERLPGSACRRSSQLAAHPGVWFLLFQVSGSILPRCSLSAGLQQSLQSSSAGRLLPLSCSCMQHRG